MPEFRGAAGAPVSRGPRASHTTEPVALAPTAVARKVESAKADLVWLLLRIYPLPLSGWRDVLAREGMLEQSQFSAVDRQRLTQGAGMIDIARDPKTTAVIVSAVRTPIGR